MMQFALVGETLSTFEKPQTKICLKTDSAIWQGLGTTNSSLTVENVSLPFFYF